MADLNPYAAPKAEVADARSSDDAEFLREGRAVPAGNGWGWIADAFALFRQQALIFILMAIALFVFNIAISIIPLVGPIVGALLYPVLAAGIVIGCRSLDHGDGLSFAHLFAGFKQNTGALVALGGIALLMSIAMMIPMVVVLGGAFFSMMAGGGASGSGLARMGIGLVLAFLVTLAIAVPMAMSLWFAPALVALHDMRPLEAIKTSFFACLKNFVPFLIYGLALMVLLVIAAIPFGLGLLVMIPVMLASIYTAYRDIFFAN